MSMIPNSSIIIFRIDAESYPWSKHNRYTPRPSSIGTLRKQSSRVDRKRGMSCVLAAPTEIPTGLPVASVIKDLFLPRLPRSVGFLPVYSWSSGDFVIAQSALCQIQLSPIRSSYSCKASCQIASKTTSSTHS
jgi:hypothetical protein